LGSSDESFWNRDLGNCMDYTMNPVKPVTVRETLRVNTYLLTTPLLVFPN
jgi:hypothetical protein